MKESKRSYCKPESVREPLVPLPAKHMEVNEVTQKSELPHLDYQKPDGITPVKRFWVIILGGEKREKDYFKIISNHDQFKRVKLEIIADPTKLSPKGMLKTSDYLSERYKSSTDVNTELDKIYLISDVDDFMGELLEIKPACIGNGYKLIISNSCFEVWLYYAFFDTKPDFKLPEDHLKTSRRFKGWANSVVKGGLKTTKAIYNIYDNIKNAKNNYQEDENGIPELFTTNMFELAEDLLPLIEPELSDLIEINRIKAAQYRETQ